MAERRMFSKKVVSSDTFLDMPMSTRALYFHLGMEADDDGFLGNPKGLVRYFGSTEDDFKLLISKGFLIPFDSGVVVIRHWKKSNYIQKDRYTKTDFAQERAMLEEESGVYKLYPNCIQSVSKMDTQDRLGKESIELGKSNRDICPSDNLKTPNKQSEKAFDLSGFDAFWAVYPHKVAKTAAKKAWAKLNPSIELQQKMGEALKWQRESAEWKKDGGRYIPYPATWLNGARWEDEQPTSAKSRAAQVDELFGGMHHDGK